MKVNIQTSNNDCGVCVLSSVYEYLYSEEIEKSKILKNFEIYNNGISIYDLEILAKEINIELTSYEVEFKDLLDLYYKDYFITLFKTENGDHFVICKIRKKYIEIFDSAKGQMRMSFEEFEKIYNNIFITFQKTLVKNELESEINIISNIKIFDMQKDYGFAISIVLLDIMILMFSLIGSGLVKLAINFIDDSIPQNLILIGIYFFIIFLITAITQYLISLIKVKKISKITKRNIVFYINYLTNKNMMFFDKNNRKKLYQYPSSISNVLSVKYIENPKLVSDLIFFVCLSCLITYISIYYMIFALIYTFISLLLGYLLKKFNDKNFENNNFLRNQTDYNFQILYDFLETEKNYNKFNNLSNKCKSLYWSLLKQNKFTSDYVFGNAFSNFIFKKIIFIFYVIFSIFWIINDSNQNIDISKMIFSITLLNLLDSTSTSIFEYISNYSSYKKNLDLLSDFVNNDNKNFPTENKVFLEKIESIKIENLNFEYDENNKIFEDLNITFRNNTLIVGKNGIGKSTLLKILSLSFKLRNKAKLFFNDLSADEINLRTLEEKICYLPSDCIPMEIDYSGILFLNPMMRKEISEFLKMTEISRKKIEDFSKGEAQLSNLFSLLKLKNNIILLDETFSNISKENIDFFMKNFYKKISDNNFVICVSHHEKIRDYFKNVVEIQ